MPFEARAFRLEILKSLVDAGNEGYKEHIRINSLLEDKAQKMAGLAGVFLAAALASCHAGDVGYEHVSPPEAFSAENMRAIARMFSAENASGGDTCS